MSSTYYSRRAHSASGSQPVCPPSPYRRLAPPPAPAEVCPDAVPACIPSPSQWALSAFSFPFSPKQIEVLDSPAHYLMLCCSRQWGKTTTIAVKALHHAVHRPHQSIVVLSPCLYQANLLIDVFSSYAQQLGFPIRRHLGRRESFVLPNGSRIAAVPHKEDTSVGRTAHIFIVDEAARVSDKIYFTASAFLTRTQGSVWLLSTPKRQTGFFYNYWHSQDAHWHRVFSPVTDCPDIDPLFLHMQQAANPTLYAQDFECRFLPSDSSLTSRDFVNRMLFSPSELAQRRNRQ
ncbi:MAG TPA: terminase family protein [Bryobacteraceae bacterium]|nr:terminase family protein [Bryobacteraceae bacterium]